jgi:integrase/recombinase XerD
MLNVKTLLRSDYKKKDESRQVLLQIYIKGKRIALPTGVEIQDDYWDDTNKLVRSKHDKAADYNLLIEQARAQVNDILIKYRLSARDLTPHLLRAEFNNPSRYLEFTEWMRKEIKDRKGMISGSTTIMHYSILSCLEKFQEHVLFSEIDIRFLERFEKHLKLHEKNKVDTISKKMRVLRLYLNRARRNKIIREDPFSGFRIKKGKGRLIYLEEHELMKLVDLYGREMAPRNMKKVLRYFLFACLTGLRISDIKRLKYENIINDIIVIIPQKKINTDHETVTIPLCRSAKKILQEDGPLRIRGKIFETYCDPVTNRYLKDIAKLKGIPKNITFHSARHTFATLFLEKTNDLATLQKLLGHASITQTMIYAHVSEVKKREQIRVFDDVL